MWTNSQINLKSKWLLNDISRKEKTQRFYEWQCGRRDSGEFPSSPKLNLQEQSSLHVINLKNKRSTARFAASVSTSFTTILCTSAKYILLRLFEVSFLVTKIINLNVDGDVDIAVNNYKIRD